MQTLTTEEMEQLGAALREVPKDTLNKLAAVLELAITEAWTKDNPGLWDLYETLRGEE